MMRTPRTAFECQRGNLTIRGYAYGEPLPDKQAVIISHGFLANQSTTRDYALTLAEDGFLTVTFDFNGGGIGSKSDGKTVDMTLLTEKEDLLSVVAAVQAQYHPASISLMGCSQGGFVSALTAKELGKGTVSGLILFYPALCIPDDARKGHMMFYRFDPNNVPDILGHIPMKLGGDYARVVMDMDPFEEIRGYDGPTLLVHGTEDNVVNINYARKAKDCFAVCEYHEIIGGGHGFSGKHDEEAKQILRAFIKRRKD